MSNEVVRYNNGLNTVPLRKFSPVEMDLFWGVCSKMKRKGTREEIFTFDQLRELISYDKTKGKERFYQDLIKMTNKLGILYFVYQTETVYDRLNLFQRFKIQKDTETLLVKVSDEFEFILNSIGKNFTRFELENMTRISSSYVKEFYRQLMSNRKRETNSGSWFVTVDKFRTLLAVPDSYRMSDIDKQIINQAKKEFLTSDKYGNTIFKSFTPVKLKAKKGNKISSFQFFFEESTLPEVSIENWLKED